MRKIPFERNLKVSSWLKSMPAHVGRREIHAEADAQAFVEQRHERAPAELMPESLGAQSVNSLMRDIGRARSAMPNRLQNRLVHSPRERIEAGDFLDQAPAGPVNPVALGAKKVEKQPIAVIVGDMIIAIEANAPFAQ
jgi:hypothetical protein